MRGQHVRELVLTAHEDVNAVDTLSCPADVVSDAAFRRLEAAHAAKVAAAAASPAGGMKPSAADGGDSSGSESSTSPERESSVWEAYFKAHGKELYFARAFYDFRTKQFRPLLRGQGLVAPSGADALDAGTGGNVEMTEAGSASVGAGAGAGASSSAAAAATSAEASAPGGRTAAAQLGTGGVKAGGTASAAAAAAALAKARKIAAAGASAGAGAGSSSASSAAAGATMPSKPAAPAGASGGGKRDFVDLCREAQAQLQLSAVPPSLPCREGERKAVLTFVRDAVAKVSNQEAAGKSADSHA